MVSQRSPPEDHRRQPVPEPGTSHGALEMRSAAFKGATSGRQLPTRATTPPAQAPAPSSRLPGLVALPAMHRYIF